MTTPEIRTPGRAEGWVLVGIVLAVLVWSGIGPNSLGTWALEIAWVVAGLVIIPLCWRRFPLSRLLCWLLAIHAVILIYGGHYTYAETPLGDWVRDLLDLRRNNYDRLGHFVQGFIPAILFRELLLRKGPLRPGKLLFVLVTACGLAFSAFFEMIEWWAALILGADAEAYLATQGDVWDTQWDMFLALCGAALSQLLLSRWHDRQLGLSGRIPTAVPAGTAR
ncbi:DUF2238 domain-containing protein [Stackebrandtia nassauensis]|uniref:Integral membrane protein n=1 Tax=Stackebrandtia nassauensis (strain DSM 44728 / CIP 108903 / NRRL B-16338 / NBRC 102104 / LLR-40K-21) TaxID=446470 RepID=D3QC22_STANL|nr:DUF2238 domain-containing protein [Stackebrandtia nassauensis]ADD44911.1 conserved hypothetical protein [Stackebrandtia nassauensis DSM 44728]